jgi:DNA-binding NtrC family response regulator
MNITLPTLDLPTQPFLRWGPNQERLSPRLMLGYHSDLSRVGAISIPGALDPGGQWCELGRTQPLFAHPWAPLADPRGVEDPYISRDQLRLRWRPEENLFEVEPSPRSRRRIQYLEADVIGDPEELPRDLQQPALLAPGSLLMIGNRLLLWLEIESWHPPSASRLGMVGESGVMWALRRALSESASFQGSVLLLGETGTGKELAARALHERGDRAARPLIALNCAALPESLAESTLFGHRRGAFTGANHDQSGLFVQAHKSSLLLDEVGELSLVVQAKLLRVLQEKRVRPVGAEHELEVDVRLIAATHRDLEQEIAQRRLREDLYYRLARHTIRLPPLRERRADISPLLVYFLRRLREAHPNLAWLWRPVSADPAPIPMLYFLHLLRRPWPGNVRQLENVAEQLARLNQEPGPFTPPDAINNPFLFDPPPPTTHNTLEREPIPAIVDAPRFEEALSALANTLGMTEATLYRLFPDDPLERPTLHPSEPAARLDALRAALSDKLLEKLDNFNYSQSHTARALGISRTTLAKLMGGLGLRRPHDIPLQEAQAALDACDGDMQQAARALRVSRKGLATHLSVAQK